jgi:hypothetical protein
MTASVTALALALAALAASLGTSWLYPTMKWTSTVLTPEEAYERELDGWARKAAAMK